MAVQTSRALFETEAEARLIRLGAWSLPTAGLMLGLPWFKPYFAASVNLSGSIDTLTWSRIATSTGYGWFSAFQVLGLVSLLFGIFVLYRYLVHLAGDQSVGWAAAVLILGVAGVVPALMMLGVLAFAGPILASLYQHGVDVCSTAAFPDLLPTALCRWWWGPLPSMGLAVAVIAFEVVIAWTLWVATWRCGLPGWVALIFGVAYLGCVAIAAVWTLVGGLLMVVAGGWIALQLKREATGAKRGRQTAASNALPTVGVE